jgi:hypothetical protein
LSEQETLKRKVFKHWGTTEGQGRVSVGPAGCVDETEVTKVEDVPTAAVEPEDEPTTVPEVEAVTALWVDVVVPGAALVVVVPGAALVVVVPGAALVVVVPGAALVVVVPGAALVVVDWMGTVWVSVTGQIVVEMATVTVTTAVEWAGQFVTVAAQEVIVLTTVV